MLIAIIWILRLLSIGLWVFWYKFVVSMACALGSPNGNCGTSQPWQLDGEDFMYQIIIPAVLVAIVFIVTGLIGRHFGSKTSRTRSE